MILSPFLAILIILISYNPTDARNIDTRRHRSFDPKIFTTCYDGLGCVDVSEKWYDEVFRPRNLEPLDRYTIRTEFILMKSLNSDTKDLLYDILPLKTESIKISGFKRDTCTKFLIHDFTSNGHTGWVKNLVVAFARHTECNLVSVDWEAGAEPPYEQAMVNARVVALEAQAMIHMLQINFSQSAEKIHLIGHGVGSHIAGYIGKNVSGIGRITALDPTGLYFQNMPKEVRLDHTDAAYVEVIHTDAYRKKSQGSLVQLGHADFYLNDAGPQPGCNDSAAQFNEINRDNLKEGKILPACSHKRAFKYFIESIDNSQCEFLGVQCKSYEEFIKGRCYTCDGNSCLSFGLKAPALSTWNHSYYLITHGQKPFCVLAYTVTFVMDSHPKAREAEGNFEMILVDKNNRIANATTTESKFKYRTLKPGGRHQFLFYASPPRLGIIKEAKVKWIRKPSKVCIFCVTSVYVNQIEIKPLEMDNANFLTSHLCPKKDSTEIEDDDFVTYILCSSRSCCVTNPNGSAISVESTSVTSITPQSIVFIEKDIANNIQKSTEHSVGQTETETDIANNIKKSTEQSVGQTETEKDIANYIPKSTEHSVGQTETEKDIVNSIQKSTEHSAVAVQSENENHMAHNIQKSTEHSVGQTETEKDIVNSIQKSTEHSAVAVQSENENHMAHNIQKSTEHSVVAGQTENEKDIVNNYQKSTEHSAVAVQSENENHMAHNIQKSTEHSAVAVQYENENNMAHNIQKSTEHSAVAVQSENENNMALNILKSTEHSVVAGQTENASKKQALGANANQEGFNFNISEMNSNNIENIFDNTSQVDDRTELAVFVENENQNKDSIEVQYYKLSTTTENTGSPVISNDIFSETSITEIRSKGLELHTSETQTATENFPTLSVAQPSQSSVTTTSVPISFEVSNQIPAPTEKIIPDDKTQYNSECENTTKIILICRPNPMKSQEKTTTNKNCASEYGTTVNIDLLASNLQNMCVNDEKAYTVNSSNTIELPDVPTINPELLIVKGPSFDKCCKNTNSDNIDQANTMQKTRNAPSKQDVWKMYRQKSDEINDNSRSRKHIKMMKLMQARKNKRMKYQNRGNHTVTLVSHDIGIKNLTFTTESAKNVDESAEKKKPSKKLSQLHQM